MRRRLGWVLLAAVLGAAGASVFSLLEKEKYSATVSLLADPAGSTNERQPAPTSEGQAAADIERASREIIARRTDARLMRRGAIAAAEALPSVEVTGEGESDQIGIRATALDPQAAALAANAFADEYVGLRNAKVVEPATPPESASSPKPVRNTAIGALAGLLFGLGLALVHGRLDRRIRDPRDLEDAFDLPVLAKLPNSDALSKRLGMAHDLPPSEAEAFRMLGATLDDLEPERNLDSVLITSAAVQDGKSTVAFNLAAAMAATRTGVLLVEAEVRRSILGRSLGLPLKAGLVSVLAGEMPLADACHELLLMHHDDGKGSPPTMDVLLAGIPNVGRLLESERIREVIRECRRNYSFVVVDTPPAVLAPVATSLMDDVSAVIVVGRVGKLTGAQAGRLRDHLEKIDAPTYGIVANFAERNGNSTQGSST